MNSEKYIGYVELEIAEVSRGGPPVFNAEGLLFFPPSSSAFGPSRLSIPEPSNRDRWSAVSGYLPQCNSQIVGSRRWHGRSDLSSRADFSINKFERRRLPGFHHERRRDYLGRRDASDWDFSRSTKILL
jgi:hypothetical protein